MGKQLILLGNTDSSETSNPRLSGLSVIEVCRKLGATSTLSPIMLPTIDSPGCHHRGDEQLHLGTGPRCSLEINPEESVRRSGRIGTQFDM